MSERPNIVIINPDQWRGDVLGHLDNPAAVTPHLDRLAGTDAVSFARTFCQNPVCTPSRCSFMSGWYPHVRGHRTMFHMMRDGEPVLLRALKEAGYFVWWGGKNDLVPGQHGYDDYCDVKYQPPASTLPMYGPDQSWRGEPGSDTYYSFHAGRIDTPAPHDHYPDSDWAHVGGAVEQILSAPEDRPLCVYLPLTYPHPPYGVEDPWFDLVKQQDLPPRTPAPVAGKEPSLRRGIRDRQGLGTWTEQRWYRLRATYYGMCARVDEQVGMITDALRRAGIYDDTALFFFSDHGDYTGDYGLVEKTQNTFEDCLTRVPFLVKPPASTGVRPRVSHALVELIDFPATVFELTGIEPGYSHFGRSLVPLMTGATDGHRDAVFCEGGRLHGERQAMELESRQSPDGLYWPRVSLQCQEGPEHTKATMCRTERYKYVRRLYETDELYDLRADPSELDNRIDDPALAEILAGLKERMLTFYQETCDVVPFDADHRN